MPEMTDDEILKKAAEIKTRRALLRATHNVRKALVDTGSPAHIGVESTIHGVSQSVPIWPELAEEVLRRLEEHYGD